MQHKSRNHRRSFRSKFHPIII